MLFRSIERYYVTPAQLEIFQAIVDNMSVTKEMRELGMSYMNSTLLYGPPGTGKTTMVKWIANQWIWIMPMLIFHS